MIEPHVGEIAIFPYDFEPEDWLRCDGQELEISKHVKLYSLLGNRYGGDGSISFVLPKMPRLATAKAGSTLGYFIATDGTYPARRPRAEEDEGQ